MESYFYGDLLDLLPVWGVGVSEGVYNVYRYIYIYKLIYVTYIHS